MWKKIAAIILPTIIAAALICFILYRVWDDLILSLQYIVPTWLLLAIAVCLIAWLIRGTRYKFILKRLDTNVNVPFSTACIYISQTANIILPARLGDFVRMFILKHEKKTPYTNSFTSLIAERVYDILIIALLGLISLPFLISIIPAEYKWFNWLIIGVLIAGVIGIIVLVLARFLHAENKIIKKILEIFAQFRTVSSSVVSLGYLSGISVVIWIMDVIVCWLVSMMFNVEIPFMLILLAIVIGNLVKAVPITPGGIGTYELALVVVFQIGGVTAASATLIAVIDHLIKNGVTLIGGIISMYYFGGWSVELMKKLFKADKKSLKEDNGNI
ncbi:MAG: lysylphosphatidylglycerol synthase transmembrane domain-containing protein [Methanocorpusculum sp.]|nr:lysylphosphatidylglycerol synthase transmembrane domain-containing protein [Methanocorpusculum sp.]